MRGGDSDDNDDDENDNKDTKRNRATPNIWSTNSLHRLHEDTMMGPLPSERIRTPANTPAPETKEPVHLDSKRKRHQKRNDRSTQIDQNAQNTNNEVGSTKNSRGGSFIAPEQPANRMVPRTGFFRWLGSALPQQSSTESETENDSQPAIPVEPKAATVENEPTIDSDLARLWWVNVWTQQLPDRPENMQQNANTDDSDNNNKSGKSRKDAGKLGESSTTNSSGAKSKAGDANDDAMPPEGDNIGEADIEYSSETTVQQMEREFVSSGFWTAIDGISSLGLSQINPVFRISRPLRPIRKGLAHITGLHGLLSGKPRMPKEESTPTPEELALGEDELMRVRRRIAAIDKAREGVERVSKSEQGKTKKRGRKSRDDEAPIISPPELKEIPTVTTTTGMTIPSNRKSPEELQEEQRRRDRVHEIDKLMGEAQKRLQELACEKDVLQKRPNPLWNYTTSRKRGNQTYTTTRRFNFPPDDVVDEYLDFLLTSGRLVELNHTDLWQSDGLEEDDDESLGDDFSLSGDESKRNRNNGKGGGSWFLRQSIGTGSPLGEKLGETVEQAAYKSIAKAVMEVLSKSISALHGVNIMTYTDIRLSVEATPDLPPVLKQQGIIPGGRKSNYAREALQVAMRKAAKRSREKNYYTGETFVQHDAVVETLLSNCQIAAPLLKLFPLAWQRALLSNIILLVTAVIADFFEGIQLEILGHRLTFSFKPITESDIMNHISMAGSNLNRPNWQTVQFERAVQATAKDVSEKLTFLDRWYERALGSGVLRSQIANLIARLVLTLVGEILGDAQMDLWAAHAGGPRMVAGLEFRTTPTYMEEAQA